jgi:hypothetical protein
MKYILVTYDETKLPTEGYDAFGKVTEFLQGELVDCALTEFGRVESVSEHIQGEMLAASEQETDAAQDLARVGQALIEVTAKMCPNWSPSDCPSEIVSDLVNERDALRAALAESSARGQARQKTVKTLFGD